MYVLKNYKQSFRARKKKNIFESERTVNRTVYKSDAIYSVYRYLARTTLVIARSMEPSTNASGCGSLVC